MGRRLAFATCLAFASSGCLVGIDESLMNARSGATGDGGGVGADDAGGGAGDGGTPGTGGGGDGGGGNGDGGAARDTGTITDPTLLGAWSFDEVSSTTAVDSSGHGNDATLSGSPASVGGRAGAALHLTSSSAMSVAALGGTSFPTEGTLSFWVRIGGGGIKPTGPAYGLFDVEDDNRSHFTLRPSPAGGYLNMEIYDANVGAQIDAVPTVAPDDVWTHVIVTWSTSGQKLAIYSAIEGANLQKHLDPIGTGFSTTEQFFRFGTAFVGDLDEVRLYSVVLDATTLAALP
jgi:hypothetical protein